MIMNPGPRECDHSQPTGLPGLHHVQIAIPPGEEDAARHFYGDMLGLMEIEKPENLRARGGVWFETATLQVHLGVDAAFRPAQKAHVAFQVANLEELRLRLSANGFAAVVDEPLPGYARFYVSDPFGNRIELMELTTGG